MSDYVPGPAGANCPDGIVNLMRLDVNRGSRPWLMRGSSSDRSVTPILKGAGAQQSVVRRSQAVPSESEGKRQGLLPDMDTLVLLQLIWGAVHGLISLRIHHPDFPWLPVDWHLDERYCQLKLILARLDVSPRQKTPLYQGFLSSGSRASSWISVKLAKPLRDMVTASSSCACAVVHHHSTRAGGCRLNSASPYHG